MEFVEISSPDLRIWLSPYGAALARVWLTGHDTSLVLGLPSAQDYANAPEAIGVVVGPIAGRVSGARVQLGNETLQMHANTPPDCLHSGADGIQNREWTIEIRSKGAVTFRCDLEHGACGLPGRRVLRAEYKITGSTLSFCLHAVSDADTYVNCANHAYWILDDTGTLAHHQMRVSADAIVETGTDLIPTGRTLPTAGTPYDFEQPRCPVGEIPLDNTFCLNSAAALDLSSDHSGIRLAVETNQPGVVLYTGEGLPNLPAPENCPAIAPFSAIAIEAQGWPDAPNHPGFPSILLRKGASLKQIARFKLSSS